VRKGLAGRALTALLATCLTTACAGGVRHRPEGLNYWKPGPRAAAHPTTVAAGAPAATPDSQAGSAAPAAPAAVTSDAPASAPDAPAARQAAAATPGRPGARTVVTGPSGPAGIITPAAGSTAASGTATPASAGRETGGTAGGPPPAPAPAPAPGATTTGLTKDTITLGVFYPRTGFYAGVARNAQAVAQAAFDEAGPINGRRVVLKYYDDGSANASTIQVEEKRARDEVFALISVVGESNVVLAPLADQHKIPLFLGNIDQKVGLHLTYAFPLYAYWAHQATILPGFIRNALGAGSKKIGVVFEGTSTAIDAKDIFKEKAKEAGLSVVFEQPIAQNQSTCANEVSNLQAHGVELAVMINGPLGAICMLRDAKALAYKPQWTGVAPSWGFNVVAEASGGGAEGVRMLRVTPTLESPEGRHYSEVMRRSAPNSGADSDDLLLIFYALLRSTIEGLRQAGPDLSRESLVRTWETKMSGYDSGYLPPPTFGPGNRSGPLVVGVAACCTDGKWTTPTAGWRAAF
jgi:ABC-type branched-subunit amino acid transport system substrate-binding protein